jgi:NADH-quinone oxidoreductase subunit A
MPGEVASARPGRTGREGERAVAQYLPILMMIVLVGLFVSASFTASKLLTNKRPTKAKTAPYECGIVSEQEPAERFPVRFYLVALTFIVLDVEIIFLYPFTTILKPLGAYGLIAMGVFLIVLLVPFAYVLSTGAVSWGPVRQVASQLPSRVLHAVGRPGRDGMDPNAMPDAPGPDAAEPDAAEPDAAERVA